MNLLIVIEKYSYGGLETQVEGQIKHLLKSGWNVYVFLGKGSVTENIPNGAKVIVSDYEMRHIPEIDLLQRNVGLICNIIRYHNIDLVHAHPFGSILPSYLASKIMSIPLLVTYHGPASIDIGAGQTYTETLSDIVADSTSICVSKETKRIVSKTFNSRSIILPNAVKKNSLNNEYAYTKDFNRAKGLIASRLDKPKVNGIKHFIALTHDTGIKIDIAGDGSERQSLEEWCINKSYNHVEILGVRNDISKLISEYDFCAGMGRFLLEAIERARPSCLIGYDGVKGFVTNSRDLNKYSFNNFSGRDEKSINKLELLDGYRKITPKKLLHLQKIIHIDYSEESVWDEYIQLCNGLTVKKYPSNLKDNFLFLYYSYITSLGGVDRNTLSLWNYQSGMYNIAMNKTVNSEDYWDERFNNDWDENAGDRQSLFFMNTAIKLMPNWLKDRFNKESMSLLDWGCAEGDGTNELAKQFKGLSISGIDFAESAIDKANKRFRTKNATYVSTDLLKGKIDQKFNFVFTSNVLEHFDSPWDVFEVISEYAEDAFIMMVPFEEDVNNLHFEHFHSFQYEDFKLNRNEVWQLIHFAVEDTSKVEGTYWNGKQALAVYVNINSDLYKSISIKDVHIHNEEIEKNKLLEIAYNQNLIENHTLQQDLEKTEINADALEQSIELIRNSRSYKYSRAISNVYARTRPIYSKTKRAPAIIKGKIIPNRLKHGLPSDIDNDRRLILESGLFDANYYLNTNADVKNAGIDPFEHYMHHGAQEFRNPSEKFDSAYYARMSKLDKGEGIAINPLLHYLLNAPSKNATTYSVAKRKQYEGNTIDELIKNVRKYDHMIIIESMSWSGSLQQRPHHLARLFAEKGVLVVYVDLDAYETKLIEEIKPNLFLIDDQTIVAKLSEAQIRNKYYWLFSTTRKNTENLKVIANLGYDLAYDYIDDFDEHISGDISVQLENYKLIESLPVSILSASASNLHKQLQTKFPNRKILLCQNAVDIDHFDYKRIKNDPSKPIDMENIVQEGKPIVGYYGAIAPWLDYELINKTTQQCSDLNFVFLGIDYNNGLENLVIRENVHFLGPKDYFKLQDYAKLFDCAIIPFEKGDIAKSTSPVKLFEYMAMALPTVCTSDLEECKGYDYVYISKTDKAFKDNLYLAIKNRHSKKSQTKLVDQAKANTWGARVETIYNEMEAIRKKEK